MPALALLSWAGCLLLPFIFGALSLTAQTPPAVPPETKQFEYWTGEWEVTWEGGRGSNSVRYILDGHVVEENFDGRPGINLTGKSWSQYDPGKNIWRQLWVDNQGGRFDLTGTFKNGKMILQTGPRFNQKEDEVIYRMVYNNIAADTFTWDWKLSKDNGKTWQLNWRLFYKRKKK